MLAEISCMILRLLMKVGFKALVPVAAVVGLGSYMSYMNGGDPAQIAQQLVAKAQTGQGVEAAAKYSSSNQARGLVENLGSTVGATLGQARQGIARATGAVKSEEQATTNPNQRTVYRWVDSSGGVQFGTHPEADARDIEAIGLRRDNSSAPVAAAAKPRLEGYPAGKSHLELLLHRSVPD